MSKRPLKVAPSTNPRLIQEFQRSICGRVLTSRHMKFRWNRHFQMHSVYEFFSFFVVPKTRFFKKYSPFFYLIDMRDCCQGEVQMYFSIFSVMYLFMAHTGVARILCSLSTHLKNSTIYEVFFFIFLLSFAPLNFVAGRLFWS